MKVYIGSKLIYFFAKYGLFMFQKRKEMSYKYIRGNGIEIGALCFPTPTKANMVLYVDRLSKAELVKQSIEIPESKVIEPNIIDNGETLDKIWDRSQDFIIANHFLEHCEDPIGTIKNHLKKLKVGGILFYAIPNKDETFDKTREVTTWRHFLNDYIGIFRKSRLQHYQEWYEVSKNKPEIIQLNKSIQELMDMNYSIHFHVWDINTMLTFFVRLICLEEDRFKILNFAKSGNEGIIILQKVKE